MVDKVLKVLSVVHNFVERYYAAVITVLVILLFVCAFAHCQENVDAPSRHMGEFYAAMGIHAAAMVTDGEMSRRWAGRGNAPCAYEGNKSYANADGTFKTAKYYASNLALYGGLNVTWYVIRRYAPLKIANHWAIRTASVTNATIQTTRHTRNIASWYHYCS